MTERLKQWAERHRYRAKYVKASEVPLGAEYAQYIVRCRKGAYLWDAGDTLGFEQPGASRSRMARAKKLLALPGLSLQGVEGDDGSGRAAINGWVEWAAWSEAHEKGLKVMLRPRLSDEQRENLRRRMLSLRSEQFQPEEKG